MSKLLRYLIVVTAFAFFGIAIAARADEPITYNKHVASILWKHCAGCHRPGEVGPFSLLNYDDAAKRSEFIREVTADRRMPPWKAAPDFGSFHGSRRLSDPDLKTIAAWVEQGAKEGRAEDLPPTPKFPNGWQLGEPDLIVKMPEAFEIPAQSRDIYRCFVMPIDLPADRTVAAVEFRPGNRRVVHHAIMYLDNTGAARKKDAAEDGPGYTSFGGPGFIPSGGLGGWAPGLEPQFLAEGLGRYLRAGSDLALQVHYHPSGKPETDQSQVGIFFNKKTPKHIVTGISLLNPRINIPPGEKRYAITSEITLPVDVTAIGVAPHMHLLGREMKVHAELPPSEGAGANAQDKTIPLVWIKDWDFNWQDQYRFAEPIRLPKGTKIKLAAYYDNSTDNPVNPNTPPKRVHWGEGTHDEMCLCTVQVYTETIVDMQQLLHLPFGRIGAALGGGSLPPSPAERTAAYIRRLLDRKASREKKPSGE